MIVFTNTRSSPPTPIPKDILKKLLQQEQAHLQHDGGSIGSPLGVTFVNFYMINLQNKIIENSHNLKLIIYCRYVDDCFIVIGNIDSLMALK